MFAPYAFAVFPCKQRPDGRRRYRSWDTVPGDFWRSLFNPAPPLLSPQAVVSGLSKHHNGTPTAVEVDSYSMQKQVIG